MADVFTPEKRSEVMSKIRATNTKPELIVRQFLFHSGLRYRIHQKKMPGNPDIVLKKYNTAIFIHGCFWHGHKSKSCKISRMPKSNISFWENKITTNQLRDARSLKALKKQGWRTFTVWECEIKGKDSLKVLNRLVNKIKAVVA